MARKKSRKKRNQRRYNKHHRKPKSRGGGNSDRNISVVSIAQHQAWHTMFANMEPWDIAERINQVWLDPGYRFIVERRE